MPETVFDEDIDISSVQKYSTKDSWVAVLATIKMKKKGVKRRGNEYRDLLEEDSSAV